MKLKEPGPVGRIHAGDIYRGATAFGVLVRYVMMMRVLELVKAYRDARGTRGPMPQSLFATKRNTEIADV